MNLCFSFVIPSGQTSADIACDLDYHTNAQEIRESQPFFSTESIIKSYPGDEFSASGISIAENGILTHYRKFRNRYPLCLTNRLQNASSARISLAM